jgi:formylglycine-generating enzyme required for sulfatase activity
MTKDLAQEENKESSYRVSRGGSWYLGAGYLVVSYRGYGGPGVRNFNLGFRLVRNEKEKVC